MVPITRLSPAGTGALQWINDAGPGLPLGSEEGAADADDVAAALLDADAAGVWDAVLVGEPPHAASTNVPRTMTPLTRTA
jgi:hypothetical protein